jgi:anti-sigma B factor antagonist
MSAMATPPEEFAISTAEVDGRAHVTLRGELDLATAPELEQLLNVRIDDSQDVVVDLRGLEFMDSSGIRVLVAAHARAGRAGTQLFVVRPEPASAVAKIVEVAGLDRELNILDDPPQAA